VLPPGYQIRELHVSDAPALADAYRRNRAHLAPWEPVREESFFTPAGQLTATAGLLAVARQGLAIPWVLTHGDLVVGRISLNNMVHGVMRSGTLGYWVDAEHLRRGLAAAAVEFACERARRRGLHRVEAGTLLHNTASQRVLERCGFEAYGVAPRLLFIAGAWQDHRLYQRILHDDPL
jgi:[ribosomal protein S5]-alanine N-acetyltransferase